MTILLLSKPLILPGDRMAAAATVPFGKLSLVSNTAGDSSRSREASEESNAETTEDAMAADDTDTGSFTAPSNTVGRASAGGATGAGVGEGEGEASNSTNNTTAVGGADASQLPNTSREPSRLRRSSPMIVEGADGNESTASTCE